MNSSALSSSTLGHSTGQRTPESQDSELTSSANQTSKILNHMKCEWQDQKQRKRLLKELHIKRVQSLRKELDYLKGTEWRYQPIDRYFIFYSICLHLIFFVIFFFMLLKMVKFYFSRDTLGFSSLAPHSTKTFRLEKFKSILRMLLIKKKFKKFNSNKYSSFIPAFQF